MRWYGPPETPSRPGLQGTLEPSRAHLTGPRREGRCCRCPPHAWARDPPQRSAGDRSKVCQRPFRSGPGRLPRPAWPPVWWLVVSGRLAFGGPPSGATAALCCRRPPSGSSPLARGGGGGFPPARRACGRGTCAAVPLRWAGRRRAAGVVGPGVRWVWPARCGARAVLPASPRARLPSALLGRVPLPPPLSGPPPTALGARRHSCGGRRRGAAAGRNPARFWRRRRPPPLPPAGGVASCSGLRCCPPARPGESCRKVSNLVKSPPNAVRWPYEHVHGRRTQ